MCRQITAQKSIPENGVLLYIEEDSPQLILVRVIRVARSAGEDMIHGMFNAESEFSSNLPGCAAIWDTVDPLFHGKICLIYEQFDEMAGNALSLAVTELIHTGYNHPHSRLRPRRLPRRRAHRAGLAVLCGSTHSVLRIGRSVLMRRSLAGFFGVLVIC